MHDGWRQLTIGGIAIDALTRSEWAAVITGFCLDARSKRDKPKLIFAANGQVLSEHALNEEFRRTFSLADGVTADGQPIVWASRLTGYPLRERAATTDLFHDVAASAQRHELCTFLLGATEENNAHAASVIAQRYPSFRIVGRRNGYFRPEEEQEVVDEINSLQPDILWVGMGLLRQTDFTVRHALKLNQVGCIITCGGLLDYFSPRIRRAPPWMQRCCLEWLFRTVQEPRKYFLRYLLTSPLALWLLITRTRTASPGPRLPLMGETHSQSGTRFRGTSES